MKRMVDKGGARPKGYKTGNKMNACNTAAGVLSEK
jgi:hypothetical protein